MWVFSLITSITSATTAQNYGVRVVFTPSMPGTFNLLHNFTGGSDGREPDAGLTMDRGGNLYGTAFEGGNGCGTLGCGTVFKLAHKGSTWVFNPLYAFAGGTDGASPEARVTVGPDGSLYGTTVSGGVGSCYGVGGYGCGTVFNLRPAPRPCTTAPCSWIEMPLYRFSGEADGSQPRAEVIVDQAGDLYGTTYSGGSAGFGVVYKLTSTHGNWTESVLHSFTQGSDGQHPSGGLIFDQSGNLYATTSAGGQYGYGTVFQLKPTGSGRVENILYNFQGASDGGSPTASLISDQAGSLYGTTNSGGSKGGGTVFELSPSSGGWTFSALYNLDPPYHGPANGGLSIDASGNLYGANVGGGYYGGGSVFKLVPSDGKWTPIILYQFTSEPPGGGGDGGYPNGVMLDANGNLFGTTYRVALMDPAMVAVSSLRSLLS